MPRLSRVRFTALSALTLSLALSACARDPGHDAKLQTASSEQQQADTYRLVPAGSVSAMLDCLDAAGIALVSAHRGGPAPGLAENAISTFERTMSAAPALLEVDVRASSDNVLFLYHDRELSPKSTGSGKPEEHDWETLEGLQLRDERGQLTGQGIPTLDEALQWADGRSILQLDIKPGVAFEDLTDLVKSYQASKRIIYIAYNLADAQKLHKLDPQAVISLSVESQEALAALKKSGIALDLIVAFVPQQPAPKALLDALDKLGIEANVPSFLGGDPLDQRQADGSISGGYAAMARAGVDIIATDRPAAAAAEISAAYGSAKAQQCGLMAPQG